MPTSAINALYITTVDIQERQEIMKKEKEITTTPGGQPPANQYPTENSSSDNYPTNRYSGADNSSRYSHPDRRPEKHGPGGEN